jgi:hypothetical protein
MIGVERKSIFLRPAGKVCPMNRHHPRHSWIAVMLCLSLLLAAGLPVRAQSSSNTQWFDLDRGPKIVDEGTVSGMGRALGFSRARLADLADLFTLQIGFGLGLHVNAHATRALQVGLGASATSRLGLDGRQAGICNESKAEFSLLPFSAETVRRNNVMGTYRHYQSKEDLPWRDQVFRDYWAVGAEVTAGVAVVNVGLNIDQLPDMLLGWGGVDLNKDDTPRRLAGDFQTHRDPRAMAAIKKIVIVPSRVTAGRTVRLAEEDGIGVYYHRGAAERFFGLLGGAIKRGADGDERDRFDKLLLSRGFDLQAELLQRADYTMSVDEKMEVVDVLKTRDLWREHAVTKEISGFKIRRLPNYAGLAQAHQADAVLDVRVWDWGVWRTRVADTATIRLDVEYKLIAQPSHQVLMDIRVTSEHAQKEGLPMTELTGDGGAALVRECIEAADVVHAKLTDAINEAQ